jgi:excisionase family DNA binding protein
MILVQTENGLNMTKRSCSALEKLRTERLTMTIPEAAHVLGISKNLMYPLTRCKDFPIIQVGTRRLVPIKAFERWVEQQTGGVSGEN